MIRICENCKYEDIGLWELPCRDCVITTNDKWEPKDAETKRYG